MSKIKLSKEFIRNTVKLALNEDLYPSGDITSDLIKNNKSILKKLSQTKKVRSKIIKLKQDVNKPDFGRD